MAVSVIDLSALIPEIALSVGPDVINRAISDIMEGARAYWIQQASQRLHSTQRDYIDGIQVVEMADGSATITLAGAWPNALEEGMASYDMREVFLGSKAGKKRRRNAAGQYYRVIPFRHQTPGTAGSLGGAPMGSAYQGMLGAAGSAALGSAIHAAAKTLRATTTTPSGTRWGGRLPAGMAPKLQPHHVTDIYAGMVRKKGSGKTGTSYTTFRTISESNPVGWIHPGLSGVHIGEDVSAYIERVAPAAFLNVLGGA